MLRASPWRISQVPFLLHSGVERTRARQYSDGSRSVGMIKTRPAPANRLPRFASAVQSLTVEAFRCIPGLTFCHDRDRNIRRGRSETDHTRGPAFQNLLKARQR
jgi:hypothetical protein